MVSGSEPFDDRSGGSIIGERVDRFREALQPIDDGDQDVSDAAVLELVHDPEPEFDALGLLDPDAEHLLRAVRLDAQRDGYGLVPNEALVADFTRIASKNTSG